MGQNGRWRRAMVDHIVPGPPGPGAGRGLGPGRSGPPAGRPQRGPGWSGIDLTLDMLRQGQRNVAERGLAERVQLVGGPGRADAVRRRHLRCPHLHLPAALRRRPGGHPGRAGPGGQARGGGGQPGVPPPRSRFWRFWWWGYTRLLLPVGGWIDRRTGVVRGGPVPRSQHLGPLPALPGGLDRRGLASGPASSTSAVRRMSLGGGLVMWGRRGRWVSPAVSRVRRPQARARVLRGAARGLAGLVDPPPSPLHRLAPGLRGHRRVPGPGGQHHPAGRHPAGLLLRRGPGRPRPRRAARPAAAHADPHRRLRRRGRRRAGRRGGPRDRRGRSRWDGRWSPSSSIGPVLVVGYNFELFGGAIHNDVGFAASWGAFPVLTAYVAQTGTLALAPVLAAFGGLRPLGRPAGPQHPGPDAAPAGRSGGGHRHPVRRHAP